MSASPASNLLITGLMVKGGQGWKRSFIWIETAKADLDTAELLISESKTLHKLFFCPLLYLPCSCLFKEVFRVGR